MEMHDARQEGWGAHALCALARRASAIYFHLEGLVCNVRRNASAYLNIAAYWDVSIDPRVPCNQSWIGLPNEAVNPNKDR
jgi:hypothetical protein